MGPPLGTANGDLEAGNRCRRGLYRRARGRDHILSPLRGYRLFTVIETCEDVVEFPAASRATAVKVWGPLEILVVFSVME